MPDSTPESGEDEFDKIVEHLDLEIPFPAEVEKPEGRHPSDPLFRPGRRNRSEPRKHSQDAEPASVEPDEELAYRTPPARPARPPSRARTLAWVSILGSPTLMVVATLSAIILPRPVVLALALTFVAAVIYLISQLPEHGPSRPDWPDDGAVL